MNYEIHNDNEKCQINYNNEMLEKINIHNKYLQDIWINEMDYFKN